ncbi:MAG: type I restriction endonuclease subunit R [Methanobrevibacter sp.]|jgi:type I restriction enzyme R subunit|nr:type I restriction endonuclease subunit R [Candidatus Methanovirga basalitermitum]
MSFTEYNYEEAIIEIFKNLGYEHWHGPEIERDYHVSFYEEDLRSSLCYLNSDLPLIAITEAINKLKDIDTGSLVDRNNKFTYFLQNGITVTYLEQDEEVPVIVKLIDFENIDNNFFKVINQWKVQDKETKIPDVVIFVNSLPLVVIELKSPSREETNASEAYTQLKNYMDKIPSLFVFNAFCVMSDLTKSKAGTITANEDRFMEWKTVDDSRESTQFADFDTLFNGMFEKERLIDILQNFILFSKDEKDSIKILSAYHQYFAVNKAIQRTIEAIERKDGKGGVFWHTQGSGKSLSMVFYTKKLQKVLNSPTFIIITDRNDLDEQLFSQFTKCSDFLRQISKKAESRVDLINKLKNIQANGIFFTTMQKFEESDEPLSERNNIIVISDEAHRSQYGLGEKVDPETGKISIGTARKVRDNFPNATFIGFTGTPISQKDKSTREVFGDYIDVYDMTQSVEDGATRPIYYESRAIKLQLDESVLSRIDKEYDKLSEEAEPYAIEKSKHELSKMEELLAAPETIDSLCNDIVNHYENDRQYLITGKAMVVAYSRKIAIKIYEKILQLRPQWKDKINIVASSSNKDPEEWHELIGTKKHKKELARRFKDNEDPFKIAIIVDMWLTGFDIPSLTTMYIFKPMKGHTLMQAIARVNRVYEDKEGGLIVDYIGISGALRKAMSEYTENDQNNYGDMDIVNTAYPMFKEKLEICQNLIHGFDYSNFFLNSDLKRAKVITGGINFFLSKKNEKNKEEFVKEALALKQSLSLCRSIAEENERLEAAYFEAVRTSLTRITKPGKISLKSINESINNLLKESIKSEGVINIISTNDEEINLFDEDFLYKISQIPEQNLAVELLKKLLNDQIKTYTRTNLVKSEQFSEMLKITMNQYINSQIQTAEVIEELINIANEIRKAEKEGNDLGLTDEELAFYDALTKPQIVKDKYENETLIQMTQELTEELNRNRTIDWQKKEGARAKMRSIVKRLLNKYKYPPEECKEAIQIVIKQCEQWADLEYEV